MLNFMNQIYYMIFNEKFDYFLFDRRLKLQKAVYLLEAMGVNLGNYGFSWYKHGPYSQELQDDAYYQSRINDAAYSTQNIGFSEDAEKKIESVKMYLSECRESVYSESDWMEAIASLYYLKFTVKVDRDHLLNRLAEEKTHLHSKELNGRALEIVDEIHNMVA